MNCFNHPDAPAVGICKSCCKGLCADCAGVVENGLACKNACEEKVRMINRMTDSSEKVLATANSRMRSYSVLYLVMGSMMLVVGIAPIFISGYTGGLALAAIGGIMVAFSLLQRSKKQMYPTLK